MNEINRSFKKLTTNNNAMEISFKKHKTVSTEDYSFNECDTIHANTYIKKNSDINYTPKKNKKCETNVYNLVLHTNNNTLGITNIRDKEKSIINIEDCSSNEHETKKKKLKRTVYAGIPSGNHSDVNNTSFETIPKKKKKYTKKLHNVELNTNNSSKEITFKQDKEKPIKNTEDCCSNEYEIKKKKLKKTVSAGTPSGNHSDINNTSFEKTPKRKLDNIEFNTNNRTEEITFKQDKEKPIKNTEDCCSNEYEIKKKKLKRTVSAGTPSGNHSDINNISFEKTPKRKLDNVEFNTNNRTEEITFKQDKEKPIKNTEDCCSIEYEIKKKKLKRTVSAGTPSGNHSEINNTSFEKTPKKKLDNVEFNTNNNTEEITNIQDNEESNQVIEDSSSIEHKIKKNSISTLFADTPLENNSVLNGTSSDIISLKIKNKCKSNLHNSELKTHSLSKSGNVMKLKTKNETSYNNIYQLNNEFINILNSIKLESNAPEINMDFVDLNLVDSLIASKPSLEEHPQFIRIVSVLSKQINCWINKRYKIRNQLEVELLKNIGEQILDKIIERQNHFMSVEDLIIRNSTTNPLHHIETKLSRQPIKKKMIEIKNNYPSIRLGIFTKDEDNIIQEYWSKFQQEYNISDVKPFLSNGLEMALPRTQRFNFFRYISAELPNRLLFSVYNRFNKLFNKQVNNLSFRKEEDQIIMQISNFGAIKNKYSVLSFILNRTRLQLFRRVNTLNMQHLRQHTNVWDITKQQELFNNILIVTEIEDWKDLKNMIIKRKTWISITKRCNEKMNNYEKNKIQWKFLSTMLFCEKPIEYATFQSRIFEYLLQLNPKNWSDIDWVKITNTFYPGANSKVIVTLYHKLVFSKIPLEKRTNAEDALRYLTEYSTKYIYNNNQKVFPRLTVEDHDVLVKIE